ncbi:DUF416 family protein [Cellulomonas telluris]|uniref:DUF416 family protein n=1 Tax=Cellulomonas telluris TaxID=2306636 RepID=UPI0010A8BDB0|nr:DUF416 family protein [Cellulomonas telluris]
MVAYDESEMTARLAAVDRAQRTAFAAACAERLWPLFERYVATTGEGDSEALRSVLDAAWLVAGGGTVSDLPDRQEVAEDMVPTDEGDWVFEMGYGQNAVAAVAYAVRTWLSDDPQEAVWAARQVYEAADLAAQDASGESDMSSPGIEDALLASPLVQTALAGLAADLATVESSAADGWELLRERASGEGMAWASTLP